MSITDARQSGGYLLGYPFRFNVTGLPPFTVEKCKLPGWEFEVVEIHGGGQTLPVKQAGGEKVLEGTISLIFQVKGEGRNFLEQRRQLMRTRNPDEYWIDANVTMMGPNDTPNMFWDLIDYWESKMEFKEFDSADKKELMRADITFQCNDIRPRQR